MQPNTATATTNPPASTATTAAPLAAIQGNRVNPRLAQQAGPVLQSAANRITDDNGYLGTGLCMRPEAKQEHLTKSKAEANWLSSFVLSVGAGVDDAICSVPHLAEDVWKGHVRPSSDRDAEGAEPGRYYRQSLNAKGQGAADLGQLGYDISLIGYLDRRDGTTVIEKYRGRSADQIIDDGVEAIKKDPGRAVGAMSTGVPLARIGMPLHTPKSAGPHLATKTAAPLHAAIAREQQFKAIAVDLDRTEGGHVVSRHGPDVPLEALKARVTTGIAPDGKLSPTRHAGRFNTYEDLVSTREAALDKLRADGVDLDQPPPDSQKTAYAVYLDHKRPIDDGYFAPGNAIKHHVPNDAGRKASAWDKAEPVSGVTGTFTRIAWSKSAAEWQVVQHFPLINGWNQALRSYPSGLQQ